VQKQLTRLRCLLGCGLGWAQGIVVDWGPQMLRDVVMATNFWVSLGYNFGCTPCLKNVPHLSGILTPRSCHLWERVERLQIHPWWYAVLQLLGRRRRIYSSSFATMTVTTKRYIDRLPGRVYSTPINAGRLWQIIYNMKTILTGRPNQANEKRSSDGFDSSVTQSLFFHSGGVMVSPVCRCFRGAGSSLSSSSHWFYRFGPYTRHCSRCTLRYFSHPDLQT